MPVPVDNIYERAGDFHRYIAEFATGEKLNENADKSDSSYLAATEIILADLPPAHGDRLALALDHSLLYHDITNDIKRSIEITKSAYDDAVDDNIISSDAHQMLPRPALLMQLLENNLKIWSDILYGPRTGVGSDVDCDGACVE